MKTKPLRILSITAAIALLYWGIAHVTWIIFKKMGVTPTPVWPAASVALISCLYYGWGALPGLALGAFLGNYISLGGILHHSLWISIMKHIAPVCGALLIRKITPMPINFLNVPRPVTVMMITLLGIPLGSAIGGILTKHILGAMPVGAIPLGLVRWTIADMLGILLLTIPYLTWFDRSIETRKGF